MKLFSISNYVSTFLFLGLLNQDDSVTQAFIDNPDKYIPIIAFVDPSEPKVSEFNKVVKARYFNDLSDKTKVMLGLEHVSIHLYQENYFILCILINNSCLRSSPNSKTIFGNTP